MSWDLCSGIVQDVSYLSWLFKETSTFVQWSCPRLLRNGRECFCQIQDMMRISFAQSNEGNGVLPRGYLWFRSAIWCQAEARSGSYTLIDLFNFWNQKNETVQINDKFYASERECWFCIPGYFLHWEGLQDLSCPNLPKTSPCFPKRIAWNMSTKNTKMFIGPQPGMKACRHVFFIHQFEIENTKWNNPSSWQLPCLLDVTSTTPTRRKKHPEIPGHALRKKGLQRRKSVGPLVSSKEQEALLVPQLNRSTIVGQLRILFPNSVYIGFRLFVLLDGRSCNILKRPWRVKGKLVSWANCSVGVQSWPAPSRRPTRQVCRMLSIKIQTDGQNGKGA